tara:strand:- start:3911 stop:4693 length:783 start_codon:yes stop_codon:yes gene_type:complete
MILIRIIQGNTMKKLLASAIIAATPVMAQADLLFTVDAGASVWNAEISGEVDDDIDVGNDGLNLDSEKNNVFFVSFEHSVPVLPNFKIKKTDLDFTGTGTANYVFLDQPFVGQTDTQVDLSHTDLTLYWGVPLPIPFFDINFGLTARQFDGVILVTDKTSGTTEKEDLNFTMPMGYLNVDFDSHFGVYARAELNAMSYDGNGVTDTEFAIGYTLPVPVVDINLEVGHRAFNVTTDEDSIDIETDVEMSGVFAGLSLSVGL